MSRHHPHIKTSFHPLATARHTPHFISSFAMMQTEEDTQSDTSSDYGAIRQRTPVDFDAHGDLRLLVRDERNPSNIDHFIVSSKAMSLACDSWKNMLSPNGPFKEAQKVEGMKEMTLPDNPRALKLLLDIAHLRFSQVHARSASKISQLCQS